MFKQLLFVIFLVASTVAENVQEKSDTKKTDCVNSYSVTCLKMDLVNLVDKLNRKQEMSLISGVSLVRENASVRNNNEEIIAELAREFPKNPDAKLDVLLINKVQEFLSSHSLKLNLFNEPENEVEEARRRKGGKKGGGGMGMLLAAGAMMKSTLFAVGLGTLAALAGKALMTALISLVLSAIIGLKSLTSGGGSSTVEVVGKPIHSSGHEEYHHGRSWNAPLPLGLQPGYRPA